MTRDNVTLPSSTEFELIAIDVDGTLLDSDFKLSDGIEETLAAVSAMGIHPVLITGRSLWAIEPFFQKLAISPYYISDGGACVAHIEQGVIALSPVRRKDAELIAGLARHHGLGMCFHEIDRMCCEMDDQILDLLQRITSRQITPVEDVLACTESDPVKITVFGDQAQLRSLDQELRTTECQIHTTFSGPVYLEITNKGVSKGSALKLLADRLGISQQKIMAFGDQENDLSVFQVAGYAVAMGNAPQVVKDAADMVALSNDEGGLAFALQRLLLNNKGPSSDD